MTEVYSVFLRAPIVRAFTRYLLPRFHWVSRRDLRVSYVLLAMSHVWPLLAKGFNSVYWNIASTLWIKSSQTMTEDQAISLSSARPFRAGCLAVASRCSLMTLRRLPHSLSCPHSSHNHVELLSFSCTFCSRELARHHKTKPLRTLYLPLIVRWPECVANFSTGRIFWDRPIVQLRTPRQFP